MERTALPRRLEWQLGCVVAVVDETPHCRSLVLDVPGWSGHTAGPHAEVRLRAEDGYQAQRSYSIASPSSLSRWASGADHTRSYAKNSLASTCIDSSQGASITICPLKHLRPLPTRGRCQ